MKKIYFILLILILCLGCTRKQETEVVANDNENIAERVNYSINSTLYVIPPEGLNLRSEPNTTAINEKDMKSNINQRISQRLPDKLENIKLNIHNFFELTIPENMTLHYIEQYLGLHVDKSQYCITNNLYITFKDIYYEITIRCYGDTNNSVLNGLETYNMRTINYFGSYAVADQTIFLLQNYNENPFINKNNIKIGRMVSYWPSGNTSDYYGLYFNLPNDEFTECIISINNAWGKLGNALNLTVFNDINYKEKLLNESDELQEFFQLLDLIEDSIIFTISNNSFMVFDGFPYHEYITDNSMILPTVNNLRMRAQPSLSGDFLGYMANQIYVRLLIGEELNINGINGNWIMIKPLYSDDLSWVFSGYTRDITQDDMHSGYFME